MLVQLYVTVMDQCVSCNLMPIMLRITYFRSRATLRDYKFYGTDQQPYAFVLFQIFWERQMYSVSTHAQLQYIPRNMHAVFALLCFVVVIHWLISPYPSGLLHWHCGNLTIAPVPAKQPWWIWINTSCEFIMNDCITTTKQSTTKPCAYFLGYTVSSPPPSESNLLPRRSREAQLPRSPLKI